MKTFFTRTLAIASLLSGTTLSASPAQAASFSWGQWTSPSSLQVIRWHHLIQLSS